ncbi:pyridoxal-dependent decarboxylase [Streptomyces sp. NPDC094032]|uniref:pyridoxal phosphate-dependent decarboxylase family protein n=1 Tax=Streptomyces sp. NPDC094032 TaxID=3155308 RepID=UPI003316F168
MTELNTPARMHEISKETEDIVDRVLEYGRGRILDGGADLGRPLTAAELRERAAGTITEDGMGAEHALSLFERVLAPSCITVDHPQYLSFIPAAPTKAATAFDLALSASCVYGTSWLEGSGVVHAENEVLAFLAREFGLPDSAAGVFVQGGTLGNLSALVTAREHAKRERTERGRPLPRRWRILYSSEAHSSMPIAARVMDVEATVVPADADGKLTGDAVRPFLDRYGEEVFAVVASAGTTNFGGVDDFASLARLRADHDFWLHIDGAYGLAAMLVPERRDLFDGVGSADSLTVDPHKWLFAPFDACALLYRHPQRAREAHTQQAEFLRILDDTESWNPRDYALHLTRRARGLPMWFSLATHGAGAYRAAISQSLRLTREIADEISARPYLSLVREPELSVVVFRRAGWDAADYAAWSQRLLHDQLAFVAPSAHHGTPTARFALVNPRTTREQLLEVLDTMA